MIITNRTLLTLVGLILLITLPGVLPAASLSGKATVNAEPISGAEVVAYPVSTLDFSQATPFKASRTGDDGLFQLSIPAGEYYLLANGPAHFSFYGRNPLSVPKEGLENINILMVPSDLPGPGDATDLETGVLGRVTADGKPVANAVVMIYPDLSSQLKGMGLMMTPPTDETGLFDLALPAGTYYFVVRVRKSSGFAGPLKAGDLFGYYPGNPLVVKEGELTRIDMPVIEVPDKVERHTDTLFGNTRITGWVVDGEGKPLEGMWALLYDDSMMLNRPLYVSRPTGSDGAFTLTFPKGGAYFLAARNALGGTPAPGELYGRYGETTEIKTGESLDKIKIVVEEVW